MKFSDFFENSIFFKKFSKFENNFKIFWRKNFFSRKVMNFKCVYSNQFKRFEYIQGIWEMQKFMKNTMRKKSFGAHALSRARQEFFCHRILHKILHLPNTLNVFKSLELVAVDTFEIRDFSWKNVFFSKILKIVYVFFSSRFLYYW